VLCLGPSLQMRWLRCGSGFGDTGRPRAIQLGVGWRVEEYVPFIRDGGARLKYRMLSN